MRTCTGCRQEKETSCFHKQGRRKDGLSLRCKICVSAENRKRYIRKPEFFKNRSRNYRAENPGRYTVYMREYYRVHKDERKAKDAAYYTKNRTVIMARSRSNWPRQREPRRVRGIFRRHNDPLHKMACILRGRMRIALRAQSGLKAKKTMELLGCSIPDFLIYLESKFEPGMTWENNSMNGWHIDHIVPCALFDLTKAEHQKACFHFSNLQPLWAKDNLSKGSKFTGRLAIAAAPLVAKIP